MEVSIVKYEKEGLCGGENNNVKTEEPFAVKTTDGIKSENESNVGKKSGTTEVCDKSESHGFFRRTFKSVLKMQRNDSANSYDVDCDSTPSSIKEDYFSENEEKLDGVDSGIASEAGDGPLSSRLSSCTNYTSKEPAIYVLLIFNRFSRLKTDTRLP